MTISKGGIGAVLIVFVVTWSAFMVSCSCGTPVQSTRGLSRGVFRISIIIRVLSAQQKIFGYGYGRSTQCLWLPNLEDFVVQGPEEESVRPFCIVMYRKARDCVERPLRYDYLIRSENLTEVRNLPPVQAIKACSAYLEDLDVEA